jgi:hypothetical protein
MFAYHPFGMSSNIGLHDVTPSFHTLNCVQWEEVFIHTNKQQACFNMWLSIVDTSLNHVVRNVRVEIV